MLKQAHAGVFLNTMALCWWPTLQDLVNEVSVLESSGADVAGEPVHKTPTVDSVWKGHGD